MSAYPPGSSWSACAVKYMIALRLGSLTAHASLHNNNLLALVGVDNWHTGDGAVRAVSIQKALTTAV
jgi:hypothetical protein